MKGPNVEVEFLDGDIVKCSASLVKEVATLVGMLPEEVAPIVARIQTVNDYCSGNQIKTRKAFSKTTIIQKLPILIEKYGTETIMELVESLKYHELKEVLNSEEPLMKIEEFL